MIRISQIKLHIKHKDTDIISEICKILKVNKNLQKCNKTAITVLDIKRKKVYNI